ncbi:hypothetical protein BH10BAC6_BH10BAC6_11960 [soil metagenome]
MKTLYSLLTVLFCAISIRAVAQPSDTLNFEHYVFTTHPLDAGDGAFSIGAALTILPQPLTEYPTPAPMLDMRWRFGLPLQLSVYGRAGSNIATTLANMGLLWSFTFGRGSFGFGASELYMYGNITYVDGFNTVQHRWSTYPMVAASWSFPAFTVSGRFELEYMTSQVRTIADQTVNTAQDQLNGGSLTLAIEQPFWKNTHVSMGVTLNYSRNPYQAWFLFNTFRDKMFYPELFVGFML